MSYWNQANFEGLRELATALRATPPFAELAEYCSLREQGLRPQALAALGRFLSETERWEADAARARALIVLALHGAAPRVHQFLTNPLQRRFLLPVLAAWHEEGSAPPEAIRWLGALSGDPSLVELALERDPSDKVARRYLAGMHLHRAEHAMHHLDESRFIGSESDAAAGLEQALELLRPPSARRDLPHLAEELSEHEQMLADWIEFKTSPTGSFPDWCNARGRAYSWPAKIYYGRPRRPKLEAESKEDEGT